MDRFSWENFVLVCFQFLPKGIFFCVKVGELILVGLIFECQIVSNCFDFVQQKKIEDIGGNLFYCFELFENWFCS